MSEGRRWRVTFAEVSQASRALLEALGVREGDLIGIEGDRAAVCRQLYGQEARTLFQAMDGGTGAHILWAPRTPQLQLVRVEDADGVARV